MADDIFTNPGTLPGGGKKKPGEDVTRAQLAEERLASMSGGDSPAALAARQKLAGVSNIASAARTASAASGGAALTAGTRTAAAGGQQALEEGRGAQFAEQQQRRAALTQILVGQMQSEAEDRLADEERRLKQYLTNMNYHRQQLGNAYTLGTLGAQMGNEMIQYGMQYYNSSGGQPQGGAGRTQYGETMYSEGGSAEDFYSDRNIKEDVKQPTDGELSAFMRALRAYTYKYKEDQASMAGAGKKGEFGVMAQDLEKSRLGKKLVEEVQTYKSNKDGTKMVKDKKVKMIRGQALGAALAAIGQLNRRVEQLENGGDGKADK